MSEPADRYPQKTLKRLGTAMVEPAGEVIAGSTGTWTITLTVGSAGIDEGGTIKIAQRFASDWEASQFDRPAESGYTTVRTNGQAKLRPHYEKKGHDRPWMQCIVIDVYDGSLAPGDLVTVVLGDRSGGSVGIRAQTFIESGHEFRVFVDPTNACVARAIHASPKVKVVSGKMMELVCVVPTQGVVGEAMPVFVKGQDQWGNPVSVEEKVEFSWDGEGRAEFDGKGRVLIREAASGKVVARVGKLAARSNPITIHASQPKLKKLWGDLHAQSDATVGTGTEVEYFTFARDVAKLDFCSHQGNDFQMTDEDWKRLNEVGREFHRDGSFVVIPGYEWSGNTTTGGDRNVWYLHENRPIFRSSHWQVPQIAETEDTPADTAGELFAKLRSKVGVENVLCGAHVGGRYADIKLYFDQELGPLVELVSCWGVFEWMLWDAFEKGYIVGVMCNSDGHKGRPGAEGPGAGQFGIANGLTCVLAEEWTREGIFSALKQRRCYGTSGPRIDLDFEVEGEPMGSLITTASASVNIQTSVRGTAPIESLELFAGKTVIQTVRPAAFERLGRSKRIRVSWRGSRIRGRGRRVQWDGAIRVQGAKILSAKTHAFDAPIDGIRKQSETEVQFVSQTTGDTDGIDLILDNASRGVVSFDSKAGKCEVELAELSDASPRKSFDFGGLDMRVVIERYPEEPVETTAKLSAKVEVPVGKVTPYFVKVTQVDGHMAWASPVYVRRG